MEFDIDEYNRLLLEDSKDDAQHQSLLVEKEGLLKRLREIEALDDMRYFGNSRLAINYLQDFHEKHKADLLGIANAKNN